MKILFSHYGYIDGGGFSRSYQLAKQLVKLGHEVTFITCQYKSFKIPYYKEKRDGVLLVSFPEILPINMIKTGFGFLSVFLKSIYVLFHKFHIVHSDTGHRPSSGVPCIVHRFFYKSKYISEWWDHFGKEGQYLTRPPFQRLIIGNYDRIFEVYNKKKADGVVALSGFSRQRGLDAGLDPGRITVVHGGADVDNIPYVNKEDLSRKFTLEDELVLGFIGINDLELGDIFPVLEALGEINLPIRLLTTGGRIREELIKKLNIADRIIELGWLNYNDFCQVIGEVDVFILLQKENLQNKARWPNKLGDYFATGRPTLVNLWGEVNAYKDKEYLFCFVEWNKISILNKLVELYNNREVISKNNRLIREFAEENISWHSQAVKLSNFYNKCLEE